MKSFSKLLEQNLIRLKEENFLKVTKIQPRTGLQNLWDRTPQRIQKNRLLQMLKCAWSGNSGGGVSVFDKICILSFLNYVSSRSIGYPARASRSFRKQADQILAGYLQTLLGERDADFARPVDYALGKQEGPKIFSYSGKRLDRNCFRPEVFVHRHGLARLSRSVLTRVRRGAILDVGAGFGDSSVVLADYTDQTVYALEPDENNRSAIQVNAAMNHAKNIVPLDLATGETDGWVWLDRFPRDFYFYHKPPRKEKIRTVSIDTFCADHSIPFVSCIKLDVEGFELETLRGARGVITKFQPVILAAVYHTGKDFYGIPQLLAKINPRYTFDLQALNQAIPTQEVFLVAHVPNGR